MRSAWADNNRRQNTGLLIIEDTVVWVFQSGHAFKYTQPRFKIGFRVEYCVTLGSIH